VLLSICDQDISTSARRRPARDRQFAWRRAATSPGWRGVNRVRLWSPAAPHAGSRS